MSRAQGLRCHWGDPCLLCYRSRIVTRRLHNRRPEHTRSQAEIATADILSGMPRELSEILRAEDHTARRLAFRCVNVRRGSRFRRRNVSRGDDELHLIEGPSQYKESQ